ncbi:MAG: AMP-binding protein [Pigmentiphaga sp.]
MSTPGRPKRESSPGEEVAQRLEGSPASANLYARFAERFEPDAVCLRLPDGRDIGYAELDRQAARYAHALVALGVQPGDRVAAQVDKSPEAVYLYLAALRAGAAFLPMNTAYQSGEVSHLLGDARPAVFVVRPAAAESAQALAAAAGVPRVATLGDAGDGELPALAATQAAEFNPVARQEGDLAAILYTSGTTGKPKGAMLTHGNLYAGVSVLHRFWRFQPDDVLLHVLPIFHIHGLFVALHCALWNASAMWFEPRFDAKRVLQLLPRSTVFMGVPTNYVRLLAEAGLGAEACRGMRLFISGSAPLLPDTFQRFQTRTGHTILERYGMTEGGMFASNPYEGERRCGTVGQPLPGVSLRVADEHDRPVPAGTIGSIQVKGANVFAGYWQLPEKTAEEHTADGHFRTGDLGVFSDDGYLGIVGRSKDLIITGGLNVYPKEIEEIIDALPGVAESAVIGLPHADFGEAVTAVVVPAANSQPDASSLIAGVKATLAGFKVPKAVHFVAELPRNTMGKVQKNLLRQQFGG